MTTVYFIRHAEADSSVRDGRIRPLTEKGLADRGLVTSFLQDKEIDVILSSPFKRAVDTLADFAEKNDHEIEIVEDFREQKSSSALGGKDTHKNPALRKQMLIKHLKQQWADFSYTISEDDDGERLSDVQKRNIDALKDVLTDYRGKNIVIGTHGTALATIINHNDNTFGFDDFIAMVDLTPLAVKMEFDENNNCITINKIDLFL